jgi:photosystem II stability/assembly factor-like uncharacterized protein
MTGRPLSPEDARRLLHDAVEAVEPAPDAVRRIHDGYRRRGRTRRIQGAAAGVVAIACAVAAAVVAPLIGQPSRVSRHAVTPAGQAPSAAALAAAIRAGQRAEHDDSGAPVSQLGLLGPEAAWVLDGNGLFRTADAGVQWAPITPPVSDPLANILCVTFSGPQDGWAIVGHPESATAMISIDRTTDGGHSWSVVPLPGSGNSVTTASISFAGPADGFAAFNHYQQPHAQVFTTDDGGAQWHLVSAAGPAVGAGIEFTSPGDGWGIDDSGRLYRTTDGGLHWSQPQLPGLGQQARQSGHGAAASASLPAFFGRLGVLLVREPGSASPAGQAEVDTTDDGGRSWQSHPLPFDVGAQLYQSAAQMPFAAAGPGAWFYFGSSELGDKTYAMVTFLRATTDGGRSWTAILPNLGVTGIQLLAFATPSDGWAVVRDCVGIGCPGTGWLLLFTSDGGRDFTAVRPPG